MLVTSSESVMGNSVTCLFCQIATHAIPAQIVYSSPDVTAFRDINPQAPTHVLVIPNLHIASIAGMGSSHPQLLARLFNVVDEIVRAEGVGTTGYRLVANSGPNGGQTVNHLHFHILGGRQMSWPPG
jgi:histidine triad (HIT) family protein